MKMVHGFRTDWTDEGGVAVTLSSDQPNKSDPEADWERVSEVFYLTSEMARRLASALGTPVAPC